uniref:Uncharacterized protein n=1 Tax=Trichobilharzia regenti TaxID=157069 RepID=A0AA85IVN7_TRIRE
MNTNPLDMLRSKKISVLSYKKSSSIRSFFLQLTIYTTILMFMTILITQLICDIESFQMFIKDYIVVPFVLFVIGSVLFLVVVVSATKLSQHRLVFFAMIALTVIFCSIGITAVCAGIKIGYNILAVLLEIASSVAAIFLGYMIPKISKRLWISLISIACGFILCALIFLFLLHYSVLYPVCSGLLFSVAIFI